MATSLRRDSGSIAQRIAAHSALIGQQSASLSRGSAANDPSTPPSPEEVAAYRRALQAMDWTFQFSDDPRAFAAGRLALSALHASQARVDPLGVIWNEVAPDAPYSPMVRAVS